MARYAAASYNPNQNDDTAMSASASAARNRSSSNGQSPGQFNDFPDWMPQSPNMGGLNALQQNIGSFFNPKPMLRQTNRAANFMLDNQRAAGQAAATAYAQRAMQSGGSSQGAGFAAASAMLPAFNQANMMRMDAQRLAAQMRGNQAQLSAGIGSNIAGLQNQHAGMLGDYAARQQAMQMQGRGLDLEEQRLNFAQQSEQSNDQLRRMQLLLQNLNKLAPTGQFNVDNSGHFLDGDRLAMDQSRQFQQMRGGLAGNLMR